MKVSVCNLWPQRFGHRLSAEEIRRMADETKVGDQWRAAGIWK